VCIGYTIYMAPTKMTSAALWAALTRLGSTLREPASLTLGGSAALLLTGMLDRLTDDGDVVESSVDFGRLLDAVRTVEVVEQTPSGWLNTSIQAYTHVLPDDFRTRLVRLPLLQQLDVSVLGRSDVILMKVYAHRPRDLQDLLAVTPTPEELAFVEQSMPRIGGREPDAVIEMQRTLTDLRAALAAGGVAVPRVMPAPPRETPPPGASMPPRPRGRGR
jgi:hypothetical protein